jgi:hypothetical protein
VIRNQWYAAIAFSLAAGSVWAADFDGSKVMVCAPAETLKCDVNTGCVEGEADNVNLDRFLRIDVNSKSVTGVGSERATAIKHVGHDGGQLVLQGSQNGRGWSAAISESTGEMTITVAGERVAFVVFGACMLVE